MLPSYLFVIFQAEFKCIEYLIYLVYLFFVAEYYLDYFAKIIFVLTLIFKTVFIHFNLFPFYLFSIYTKIDIKKKQKIFAFEI